MRRDLRKAYPVVVAERRGQVRQVRWNRSKGRTSEQRWQDARGGEERHAFAGYPPKGPSRVFVLTKGFEWIVGGLDYKKGSSVFQWQNCLELALKRV